MASSDAARPYRMGVTTLFYAIPFSLGIVIVLSAVNSLSPYISTMDDHVFSVTQSVTVLIIGSMFLFFGVFSALSAVNREGGGA